MAKNTDSSIKLLVLYDILLKSTDEEHALSTNEIIEELKKRGISVSRKVLPSDIDLLNKYGYEICSYVKKARYYYAVHQLFDTAEITMLTDVIKAAKEYMSQQKERLGKLIMYPGKMLETKVLVEDVGCGIGFQQALKPLGYKVDFIHPTEDKKTRCLNITPLLEQGGCLLPDTEEQWFDIMLVVWNVP